MGGENSGNSGNEEWLHQVFARFEDHTLSVNRAIQEIREETAELRRSRIDFQKRWEEHLAEDRKRWAEQQERWDADQKRWEDQQKRWESTGKAILAIWEKVEKRPSSGDGDADPPGS